MDAVSFPATAVENLISRKASPIGHSTDLYKYSPDAVPPIHAVSYHVATDKLLAQDGDKFRYIFSDNLQPIATRGKKARGTLLVNQHCDNGCSIKCAPLFVIYWLVLQRS